MITVLLCACLKSSDINSGSKDPFAKTPSNPNWQPPSDPIPSTSAFPKTKEEYRVLYYWLAQYTEQDVTIPHENITYDVGSLPNNDAVFKTWAAFSNRGRELANVQVIQVEPKYFLLSNIDRGGKLYVKNPTTYDYADPVAAAWWYKDFDYAKNPHYQRAAVMNRGLIHAMIQLIKIDDEHEKGNFQRSDYIGGSLIKVAVAYDAGKKLLPTVVQKAYETLLLKEFERAESWKLVKLFGDMESMSPVGMYYVAKAIGDPALMTRAATHAQDVYDTMMNGAGFEKHENGADVVYQGIYLFYASWLLSATQADPAAASLYQFLIPYIDRACKFLNYMTIVEPTLVPGELRLTGPSHFNAANPGSPGELIWNIGFRGYLAGAMYSNQCKTRILNQDGASYAIFPLDRTVAQMKSDLQSFMSSSNFVNNGNQGTNSKWSINYENPLIPTDDWSEGHWGTATSTVYTYSFFKNGFYNDLITDLQNNEAWTKYPFQFTNNYIETLDDINEPVANKKPWFVIAKSSNMHTIWHLGTLAWRNQESTNIAGFGGGAISSVSTVGPIIMGRERGNQQQMMTLAEWRIWATHHMAGADENGNYFGTARDRDLNRTVTKNGNTSVTAVVTGTIGPSNNKTAPNGSITGSVNYQRTFAFNQSTGINVTSILNSDTTDQATELYEIIPVYLYDPAINDIVANPNEITVISFYKNGSWVTPTTNNTTGVTDIRLSRYNAPLYIHFATAQSVKLAPTEMVQSSGNRSHNRNILIDLLKNNGSAVHLPSQTSITYTINTTSP